MNSLAEHQSALFPLDLIIYIVCLVIFLLRELQENILLELEELYLTCISGRGSNKITDDGRGSNNMHYHHPCDFRPLPSLLPASAQ